MNASDTNKIRHHVADLEQQLQVAKAVLREAEVRVSQHQSEGQQHRHHPSLSNEGSPFSSPVSLPLDPSLHYMLLLSDSALPLGSFAYSSGLESYLAHHKPLPPGETSLSLFHKFLKLSIQSLTFTNVPYVLAAFRDPLALMDLDNDLDASTPCTVQRRASIAQGRALLSVWDRAMTRSTGLRSGDEGLEAVAALDTFSSDLRAAAISSDTITVNGHLAPLWGAVSLGLGLNLEEAGYLFVLNHAKAVISAGVRASVMGPYMAQSVLASQELQDLVRQCLEQVWFLQPDRAGQVVPIMDLWVGRHEMLYSRIFNS